MRLFLSLLFTIALSLWTVLLGVFLLPLLLLPAEKLWWFGKLWAHGVLFLARWVVGIRYEVQDPHGVLQNLTSPVIFASRHESAFEAIAFVALLPRSVSVIKKELLSIPFYGWYCRKIGSIAINRKGGAGALKAMQQQAQQALNTGKSLIVFPEGTRVKTGECVPLKSGITALYEACNVPVVPITVNSGLVWPKNCFIKNSGIVTISLSSIVPPNLDRASFQKRLREAL